MGFHDCYKFTYYLQPILVFVYSIQTYECIERCILLCSYSHENTEKFCARFNVKNGNHDNLSTIVTTKGIVLVISPVAPFAASKG